MNICNKIESMINNENIVCNVIKCSKLYLGEFADGFELNLYITDKENKNIVTDLFIPITVKGKFNIEEFKNAGIDGKKSKEILELLCREYNAVYDVIITIK